MQMNQTAKDRIRSLLAKYAANTCTRSEMNELMVFMREAGDDVLLNDVLQEQWDTLQPQQPLLPVNWEQMFSDIVTPEAVVASLPASRPIAQRWWVAAAILLLLAGGSWFWLSNNNKSVSHKPLAVQDVPPGGSGAILTLADGTQVVLDSTGNGNIATQANARISKLNGKLVYEKSGVTTSAGKPLMNTLSTPRGRQYQLVLPDGTIAWLNAASSIEYPAVFTGKERRVSVTGEVYLEVAAQAGAPFMVNTPTQEIMVLGTSFNINTYSNEKAARTTLLNGSIRIHLPNSPLPTSHSVLKPGQQATVTAGKLDIREVDAAQSVAWIKGQFWFSHASVPDVMRELERWYDVEIVYEGAVPQHTFGGKLERNLPLSAVVKFLEESDVHCEIQGRKLIVKPD